jgi:uncharacterized SAM-binding protein YcdF (DUF218 family)
MLVKEQSPFEAPVAVVLAGDHTGRRIIRGAGLARDGHVRKVLVSGVPGFFGAYESDLAVKYAVSQGFPEHHFEVLRFSYHSTQEEAFVISGDLRRRGIRRALVVTSDYHTWRAGMIWRQTAPWLELHMVGAPDNHFHRERWWSDRESAKRVFDEWTKLAAFTFDLFRPTQSGPVLP